MWQSWGGGQRIRLRASNTPSGINFWFVMAKKTAEYVEINQLWSTCQNISVFTLNHICASKHSLLDFVSHWAATGFHPVKHWLKIKPATVNIMWASKNILHNYWTELHQILSETCICTHAGLNTHTHTRLGASIIKFSGMLPTHQMCSAIPTRVSRSQQPRCGTEGVFVFMCVRVGQWSYMLPIRWEVQLSISILLSASLCFISESVCTVN